MMAHHGLMQVKASSLRAYHYNSITVEQVNNMNSIENSDAWYMLLNYSGHIVHVYSHPAYNSITETWNSLVSQNMAG